MPAKKRVATTGSRPLLNPKKQRTATGAAVPAPTAVVAPKAKAAAKPKASVKPKAAAAAGAGAGAAKGKGKGKGKKAVASKRPAAAAAAAAADDAESDADEREQMAQLNAILNAPDGDDADGDADDGEGEEDDAANAAFDRLAMPPPPAPAARGAAAARKQLGAPLGAVGAAAAAAMAAGAGAGDDDDSDESDSDFSDVDFDAAGDEFPSADGKDAPPIHAAQMAEVNAYVAAVAGASKAREQKQTDAKAQRAAQLKAVAAAAAASAARDAAAAKSSAPTRERAVIYIGHVPYGFFEDQIKAFFSQFGDVLHYRLARNRKTGKSRHYGWVEFSHLDTAETVAKTMNNYMMFGRTLRVELLPQHKIHDGLFANANKPFRKVPWRSINREAQNKQDRTAEEQAVRTRRLLKAEDKRKAKLKDLGIEYDYPGYRADMPTQRVHQKFD